METWLKSEKIRVLLVEDDEDDYILTSSLLTEIHPEKFEHVWAETYEEGLSKLSSERLDVCLFDYRLGQHNGLELLRDARDQGFSGPIILLTGQSDPQLDFEAMRAGASDYLVKDQINAANLERSIRYSIQQKQMVDERIRWIREQEARTHAEAANKAKDEFLAMVSHELRTPLNAMLGWVGILRGNKGDPDVYARAIDAIERSAKAQNRLVNDLLDISRISSGNLWLERQPVSLVSVIEPVIDEAFPAAEGKSITLETDLDPSPRWVNGDPNRLQQVVNNLVQNAIKFTPEGGRVSVSLKYADGTARVTVEDTGKGIGKEFLPYVFDRYRQAKGKERGVGLGLGLAIARHIIELHDGAITAESEGEGSGSTFTVTLPVSDSIAATT
jgi:signal transduction histidine kinase